MVNESMRAMGHTRSCIRELFEYGKKQAAVVGKENVFDFSIGNPSIPAPEGVNEAIINAVQKLDSITVHGYTSSSGNSSLRKMVTDDLNRRYGTHLTDFNIFFTCGAAPAVVSAVRALAISGAEILVQAPFFPEYRVYTEPNGAKLVVVPPDRPDFQINFPEMEKRINVNTQAVIVNSPNNPTGVIYSLETLEKLASLLRRKAAEIGHPIYIISDEPYRELVYDHAFVPFIPSIYPNTIVCYSFSKALSVPGERIGYVLVADTCEDEIPLMDAIMGAARSIGHVCAPSLQQRVVALCAHVWPDMEIYNKNRLRLYDALTSYGYECVKPRGAFYMFVKAPGGNAKAFSDRAKAKNLLIVPGDDFGCPDYLRISTCVSYEMLEKSLPVFKELIDEM
jgi:aspartate aminotransferase